MTRAAALAALALSAFAITSGGGAAGDRLRPIAPDSPARDLAREAGIAPSAVKHVIAVGRGWGRLSLLAARSGQRLCLSSEVIRSGYRFASPFRCVPRAASRRPPLVAYGVHDDAQTARLRVTIVGLLRPEVTHVVVSKVGGGRHVLRPLKLPALAARAFGYAGELPLDRPRPRRTQLASVITAYRGGKRVATVDLRPRCCVAPPAATLTDAEKARALELATSDPRLAEIIGERPVRVVPDAAGELVGVWHTYKTHEKIGAAVELGWDQPLAIDYRWSATAYDYTEISSPPYREGHIRLRTTQLTRLTVLVDLRRDKVVAIGPGPRCCG